MGRKRDHLSPLPRYEFIVFGKPVSVWTGADRNPEKSAKYSKWRDNVAAQIDQELREQSGDRGFEWILDPVCARLIWYSPKVDDPADPDLDNFSKPYLDAIKGRIIPDDRKVE